MKRYPSHVVYRKIVKVTFFSAQRVLHIIVALYQCDNKLNLLCRTYQVFNLHEIHYQLNAVNGTFVNNIQEYDVRISISFSVVNKSNSIRPYIYVFVKRTFGWLVGWSEGFRLCQPLLDYIMPESFLNQLNQSRNN